VPNSRIDQVLPARRAGTSRRREQFDSGLDRLPVDVARCEDEEGDEVAALFHLTSSAPDLPDSGNRSAVAG